MSFQALGGSSIWAAMMLMAKIEEQQEHGDDPGVPGVLVEFLDSSFKLVAVSQPQKKKTPRTPRRPSAPKPWIEPGLSQDRWKPVDPAGWLTATLMIPQMEKTITARYSMMSRTHWKLVVQRMPQMQMKVIRASQQSGRDGLVSTLSAEEAEIQPTSFMNCRV